MSSTPDLCRFQEITEAELVQVEGENPSRSGAAILIGAGVCAAAYGGYKLAVWLLS